MSLVGVAIEARTEGQPDTDKVHPFRMRMFKNPLTDKSGGNLAVVLVQVISLSCSYEDSHKQSRLQDVQHSSSYKHSHDTVEKGILHLASILSIKSSLA